MSTEENKEKEKEKDENEAVLIIYVGVDKRYCESLREKLKTTYREKATNFTFKKFHTVTEDNYVDIVKMVLQMQPALALIDYSFQSDCMLKVATVLRQIRKDLPLLALYEHQTNFSVVIRSIQSGVLINHLKSGDDNLNTIYSLCYMTIPDQIEEPEIAKYQIKEGLYTKVIEQLHVNHYTKEGFRIETNHQLTAGEEVEIENKLSKDVMPSKKFLIKEASGDGEHFYDRKYWALMEYLFIDPINVPSRATTLDKANLEEDRKKRVKEIEEEIKPKFLEWFTKDLAPKSTPQNIKILIIDKTLKALQGDTQWIEDIPYNIRLKINIHKIEDEIRHFKPIMIAFRFETLPEEMEDGDEPVNYNNNEALKTLIQTVQGISAYTPYIVSFNDKEGASRKLKKELGYSNFMASQDNITLDIILKFASIYETKNKEKIEQEQKGKVYMNKHDEMSTMTFKHMAQIVNINEVAFEFTSKVHFELYQTYLMEQPFETYFTVFPHRKSSQYSSDNNCYRGIFHSYNDEQKKDIRKFIISKK